MTIKSFKMWEDAAANSAGGGAIHGIGVGPKGEPGVHLDKNKKKKKQEKYAAGSRGPADGWETRSKAQRDARTQMWKAVGKKLKRK